NKLQLLGYDAPAAIEPGGRVAVKLYWRLRKKTPNDVSVSLRVVDAQGAVWGQWDAPPIGNLYPVSDWKPHTIYLDMQDLVVDPGAPPGTYSIELNVYRSAGHAPLAARRADGSETDQSIRLAQVRVTRPTVPLDPRTLLVDQHPHVPFGGALNFVGYDLTETTNPGSLVPVT